MVKDELFKYCTDEDIYKLLFKEPIVINKLRKSPFPERKGERTGSFHFFIRQGEIFYKDFGDGSYRGDCINFIMQMKGFTFGQAIKFICENLNINLETPNNYTKNVIPPKLFYRTNSLQNIVLKDYNDTELAYWKEYGIEYPDLEFYKTYSVESFELTTKNGNVMEFLNTAQKPLFQFTINNEALKIYNPKREKIKNEPGFFANSGAKDIFGWEQLPEEKQEFLFICAGNKDTIALNANTGLFGITFNSEELIPDNFMVAEILGKADKIIVVYDIDSTGKRQAEKLKNLFMWDIIELDDVNFEGKDLADLFITLNLMTSDKNKIKNFFIKQWLQKYMKR